ncbi:MAG: beta-N-acetylhexosaminidase [Clostridia bacterium]|nr:beta-N-acetylhexosaminidase [Clostridia bacterium]
MAFNKKSEIKRVYFTFIDDELLDGFREICEQASLELAGENEREGAFGIAVIKGDKFSIERVKCTKCGATAKITYTQKAEFFRACSMLAAFIDSDEADIKQIPNDSMLCLMADMSRNAVYNIPSAKRMIRYLALMGFNSLMLYTEDTYELPGYPYFGHMRGRFTKQELKEIDDYAYMLGIEVIPCVQALAHLSTALRWPDFHGYKDTNDILLVGHEKTYNYIKAVLDLCSECFRSRRINLGMDEAFQLGRGQYLTKNGYRTSSEIMLEHLDRVINLCSEAGLAPMIWSDMFFRIEFNGQYRVAEGEISKEVIDLIPDSLTPIYWDYNSLSKEIFSHMIDCHLKFKTPVIFAGGAWKWSGFAPHNRRSLESTKMQLDVCESKGVKNIIVTAWGDNGGEASQFAPLPVLLYFAERVYCKNDDTEHLEVRSKECFNIGYEALLTLDAPNELPGAVEIVGRHPNPSRYLLYNDPLEGLFDRHLIPETVANGFKEAARRLEAYCDNENFGYIYQTLASLCRLLAVKADLSERMRTAYCAGDRQALTEIKNTIPEIIALLEDFINKFRTQWYLENKTFGLTNSELRLGGLKERLYSTKMRLESYLDGKIERIEELEQPSLPIKENSDRQYVNFQNWTATATVGVM